MVGVLVDEVVGPVLEIPLERRVMMIRVQILIVMVPRYLQCQWKAPSLVGMHTTRVPAAHHHDGTADVSGNRNTRAITW